MAARDVVTASALQLMSMAAKGREEGVFVATVTVPVNKTNGEVGDPALRERETTTRRENNVTVRDTFPIASSLVCPAVMFFPETRNRRPAAQENVSRYGVSLPSPPPFLPPSLAHYLFSPCA